MLDPNVPQEENSTETTTEIEGQPYLGEMPSEELQPESPVGENTEVEGPAEAEVAAE